MKTEDKSFRFQIIWKSVDRSRASEISYSLKAVVLKVKFVRTNNKNQFGEVFAILCLREEMVKKERRKIRSNRLSSFFLFQVTIQTYFTSTNCTVLPFVSGPFSHFLFKLNEMTMNLLTVVKINSMTFTDRNLYTYKKYSISFSKQLYLTCKLSSSGQYRLLRNKDQ